MNPYGKSVRIYFSQGITTGIRYAELVNWTGQALICPRNRLDELTQWECQTAKPGIYFLVEREHFENKPLVYIGESENPQQRLAQHDQTRDFWGHAIIFTNKDENLTKAHIKYLESRLVELARAANRYTLENGNQPTQSNLPIADKDAMEEFIQNIKMILSALGYSLLESLPTSSQGTEIELTQLNQPRYEILSFSIRNLHATGFICDEGFMLQKGAQVAFIPNLEERCLSYTSDFNRNDFLRKEHRKKILEEEGILSLNQEKGFYEVMQDFLVGSSPSYAASFVASTQRNGLDSWKNSKGQTLNELKLQKPTDLNQ